MCFPSIFRFHQTGFYSVSAPDPVKSFNFIGAKVRNSSSELTSINTPIFERSPGHESLTFIYGFAEWRHQSSASKDLLSESNNAQAVEKTSEALAGVGECPFILDITDHNSSAAY